MSKAQVLSELLASHQTEVMGVVTPVLEQVAQLETALEAGKRALEDVKAQLAEADSKIRWYQPKLRETRAELSAAKRELRELSQALEKYSVKKREAFKVDPDFDPERDLSPDDLKLYRDAWAEVEDEWARYIEPLSRGCKPGKKGSKEPLPEGGMHLMTMRDVGHVNSMLTVFVHQLGDPAAFKRLRELWQIVLDKKIMADRWGPLSKAARTKKVGAKVIDLEPVGVWRFNYMPADGSYQNDLHELDQDLQTATVAEAAYVFKINGAEAELKLTLWYCEELVKRITRLAEAFEPGEAWYVQGKSLRHPSVARRGFHFFMWLLTGSEAHKVAWEWYARHLAADEDYLTLPVGEGVFVPHYTVSLIKERGDTTSEPGLQDITYLREDVPHEVFALWAGAPFVSERFVAARARTVLSVALFGGAKGDKISASTGGYGPREYRGKDGVYVAGTWVPGRWKNGRLGDTEAPLEITRSFPTLGAVYATDHPEYLQTLKDFDGRPDSVEHGRHGGRISRLLYIARR